MTDATKPTDEPAAPLHPVSSPSVVWRGLCPLVVFDSVELHEANKLLVAWGHKMGPINRPMNGKPRTGGGDEAHALFFEGEAVAVTVTSTLVRENVAQRPDLTRANTCELSRVCAARPHLCRVAIRLWREVVFELLPFAHAISYQDAVLHSGNLYRFDGWTCIVQSARSGTDTRSGRKGRRKRVWLWSKPVAAPCP